MVAVNLTIIYFLTPSSEYSIYSEDELVEKVNKYKTLLDEYEKLKKDIQVGLDDPVTLEGHSAMKELMKKYE